MTGWLDANAFAYAPAFVVVYASANAIVRARRVPERLVRRLSIMGHLETEAEASHSLLTD